MTKRHLNRYPAGACGALGRTVTFGVVILGALAGTTGPAAAERAPQATTLLGAPVIKSVRIAPSTVAGSGGTATVTATLSRGSSCQLVVVSHPVFEVAIPKKQNCKTSFTAYVKLGANPTPVKRAVALDLVATRQNYHAKTLLYVSLAAKPLASVPATTTRSPATMTSTTTTTTTTSVPVAVGGGGSSPTPATVSSATTTTTTTAPAPPPANPTLETEESSNWSGYALDGGPVTSVTGTFTVPSLGPDATCATAESQWVGVDGATSTDTDLLQAGVDEIGTQDNPADSTDNQCSAPNRFYVNAWWEILPAAATDLTIQVNPGDKVQVNISNSGDGDWQVSVTDLTDGQSYTTSPAYAGPATSAEWVTEASTSPQLCHNSACPETSYSPPVTFSGLNYALQAGGLVSVMDEISMVQHGVTVSTPSALPNLSALLADGFTTTYTG